MPHELQPERSASDTVPALHCTHTDEPAAGVTEPAEHRLHAVLRDEFDANPIGQGRQTEPVLKLPAPQSRHAVRLTRIVPAGQAWQAVAPVEGLIAPAAHVTHAGLPGRS